MWHDKTSEALSSLRAKHSVGIDYDYQRFDRTASAVITPKNSKFSKTELSFNWQTSAIFADVADADDYEQAEAQAWDKAHAIALNTITAMVESMGAV